MEQTELHFPFGHSKLSLRVPSQNLLGTYFPRDEAAAMDEASLLAGALANPVGSPRLSQPGQYRRGYARTNLPACCRSRSVGLSGQSRISLFCRLFWWGQGYSTRVCLSRDPKRQPRNDGASRSECWPPRG